MWTGVLAAVVIVAAAQGRSVHAKTLTTAERCQALSDVHMREVEVTTAKVVPPAPAGQTLYGFARTPSRVGFPEYCRIDGVIARRNGAGGVEYGIGFALALPSNWNGRLLFQGGSAYDGHAFDPYGLNAAGDEPALARGFAVLSMNAGHESADAFETSFMKDQQAALDFAFNALPTVMHVGSDLVRAYFGRAPHHTYSDGCSTGGREGMLAAERYPSLFDGIVAGDPAMRSAYTRIPGWNATVAFNRIAPRDGKGDPLRLQAFPPEDQKLLHDAVAAQCDGLDGLNDGLILNLAACRFDPAVLQCQGAKNASCLTAEQINAVKTAFDGPRDADGKPYYSGFPYDLGLLGEDAATPGHILPGLVPGIYDNPPSAFSADFSAEIDRIRTDAVETLTDTATWTDLGSFYRRGGKIIFYSGASDPWFSLFDTLDYVQRNKATNPDFDSSRFYSVAGMGHCGNGGLERFDMLSAIVDWVEHGVAPARIVATDVTRQIARPLCPWPQYARYEGAGDSNAAASFECRTGP